MAEKKIYTKTDFDKYTQAVKAECEKTLVRQRERIAELKTELKAAEEKAAGFEAQKELIYKAITAALKKADDIERVSLMRYNHELAQLKAFHERWIGYFNKIIEKYPLSDELVTLGKVNGKIAETLARTGDLDESYEEERQKLMASLEAEKTDPAIDEIERLAAETVKESAAVEADKPSGASTHDKDNDDYADRSPAGFSFSEALHPKDDLEDIMRELGIMMEN